MKNETERLRETAIFDEILEEIEEPSNNKYPHYSKALQLTQLLTTYNTIYAFMHEDPKLKQQPRHVLDSDLNSLAMGSAHYTYFQIRSIIQGN